MSEKIKLEYSLNPNQLQILESDDTISICKLMLLHLGTNYNNTNISKECVDASIDSFFDKPIAYILNAAEIPGGSTDITEHAENQQDEYKIQIAGIIPESSPVSFEENDGLTQLCMTGIIYKMYQQNLMEILDRRGGNVKVSIEILPIEAEQGDDGILYIKKFQFLSCFLLGEKIPEGIKDSHLEITKFSANDLNKKYLRFAKKYDVPKDMLDTIQSGIEMFKKYPREIESEYTSLANLAIKNKSLSYAEIDHIKNLLSKFDKRRLHKSKIPTSEYMKYMLIGGDAAKCFVESEVNVLNKETFVKKEDMGSKPAIKVNESKDAVSNDAWSDVDKSKLAVDALECSNYKTAVPKVFLKLEDGWEEGKQTALGYPVMQHKGDEFVYNRAALGNAKARAVQQNENDIVAKLDKIYKSLGLDDKKEGDQMDKEKDKEKEPEKETKKPENEKPENKAPEKEKKDPEVDKNAMDDMKKECDALKAENEQLKNKLAKYLRIENKSKMHKYIEDFKACMDDASFKKLSDMIPADNDDKSECDFEKFAAKVDEQVKEFARKYTEKVKSESKKKNYSESPFGVESFKLKIDEDKPKSCDDIIKSSNVKIK